MNKNAWVICVTACLCLCAAGFTLGQQQHVITARGRTLGPFTPKQMATIHQKGQLDQAAIAALDSGDYAQEEEYARQSLSLGIGSGLCQDLLAQSLNDQGKDQEALQVYKTIADQGAEFPRDLVPYARLLLKSGQWAQAVNVYNKVLPLLPQGDLMAANSHFSPDVAQPKELATALYVAQGLTYWGDHGWGKEMRREDAMQEFNQALKLAPNAPLTNYYYGFGWKQLDLKSKMRLSDAPRAKIALQKAALADDPSVKKAASKELRGLR